LLCQAAIKLQRTGREDAIWTVEKLEDRMSEMRAEIFALSSDDEIPSDMSPDSFSSPVGSDRPDPFHDEHSQSLIGVASFYLESLFYNLRAPFEYTAPIVSPNGKEAGKLRVRLERISGRILVPDEYDTDEDASPSADDLTISIEIVEAIGLSPTLAHFVECQYTFPGTGERILVPPMIDESLSPKTDRDRLDVRYRHTRLMTITVEPDTLDEFERGALQIELMGHQDRYRAREKREESGIDMGAVEEECRSMAERWADVSRRVKLEVEIQEMEDVSYQPVELERSDTSCGGVFQLRAGMSRRIHISTRPNQEQGHLPLVLGDIAAAEVGSVLVDSDGFSEISNPDSYQEQGMFGTIFFNVNV